MPRLPTASFWPLATGGAGCCSLAAATAALRRSTVTGNELWGFQTDAGVSAPVTIVESQGQLSLVVLFLAGNVTSGSVRGDSVWLLSLKGTMAPTERPSTVVQIGGGFGGRGAVIPELTPVVLKAVMGRTSDPVAGKTVYTQACMFCHEADGRGGAHGPAFRGPNELDAIVKIISDGTGAMPKLGLTMKPGEIQDAASYVLQEFIRKP